MRPQAAQRLAPLVDSSDALQPAGAYGGPRHTEAVPSGYPRQPTSGPGSTPSLPDRRSEPADFTQDSKIEAEIEAERLWWSEVSERQVKELESSFGEEFQKTTSKLRSDIERCQDRLEMMVETEKKQRHAAIADIKRELDDQRVAFADLRRDQLQPGNSADFQQASMGKTAELITRLQGDMAARDASLRAEWEQHKLQSGSEELRAALSALREHQQLHLTQIKDLRRDLSALQEKSQLQAQSNEEVQQLHQVIMQSAGDLSRGMEEVSHAVASTEHKLRQELEATRRSLEAADAKLRAELLEASEFKGKQLAQQLGDERENRSLEANVLRTRLEAACGQLGDLQASLQSVAPAAKAGGAVAEPDALRALVDKVRGDLVRLEETVADDRVLCLNAAREARCRAEELATMSAVTGPARSAEPVATTEVAGGDSRDVANLAPRVAAIEEQVRKYAAAAVKVEALEAELQRVAREPDLRRLQVEVDRTMRELSPLASRIDTVETEARQATRETSALFARLDAAEAALQRVVRDTGPVAATVQGLHTGVQELQQVLANMQAGAVAVPRPDGVPLGVSRGRSPSRPPPVQRPHEPQEAQIPRSEVPLPALSSDLKLKIESLVQKVSQTLSKNDGSAAVEQVPVPGPPLVAPVAGASAVAPAAMPEPVVQATQSQWPRRSVGLPMAGGPMMLPPSGASQDGYLQALQAVHQLRERNLCLREENAELVEELLNQEMVDQEEVSATMVLPAPAPPAQQPQPRTRIAVKMPAAWTPTMRTGAH